MIGVLLFLQEVVLLQKEAQFKGAKYASFMAEFQKSRICVSNDICIVDCCKGQSCKVKFSLYGSTLV